MIAEVFLICALSARPMSIAHADSHAAMFETDTVFRLRSE